MSASLLAAARRSEMRLDPFPHLVIPDALPGDVYAALCAGFPSHRRIVADRSIDALPNNKRYVLSARMMLDAPDVAEAWKTFAGYHSSPAFLAEVAALFEGHWPAAMLRALDGGFAGKSAGRLDEITPGPWDIHQDARIEINTPVRGFSSTPRAAHLDTPNRLYSGLFYMRAEEDDSEGGELILYRWRDGPAERIDRFELPHDAVEPAAAIPYRANQLVIFPQTIDSIHGVGVRAPTPHIRRYVFVTAELGRDWLEVE